MPDDADVGTGAELWSYMAEDQHGVDRYFLSLYSLCAGSLSTVASTRDGSASGTPSPASSAPPSPPSQSTEQHPPP